MLPTTPGPAGAGFTVTAIEEGALLPQELLAVTLMLPLTLLAVAVIRVSKLVPVQPLGSVHV